MLYLKLNWPTQWTLFISNISLFRTESSVSWTFSLCWTYSYWTYFLYAEHILVPCEFDIERESPLHIHHLNCLKCTLEKSSSELSRNQLNFNSINLNIWTIFFYQIFNEKLPFSQKNDKTYALIFKTSSKGWDANINTTKETTAVLIYILYELFVPITTMQRESS